jgi:hypothetical protein
LINLLDKWDYCKKNLNTVNELRMTQNRATNLVPVNVTASTAIAVDNNSGTEVVTGYFETCSRPNAAA